MTRSFGMEVDVKDVHDGDTIYGFIDQGIGLWNYGASKNGWGLRLWHASCIEIGEPGGIETRDYVRTLIHVGDKLPFESMRWDKYSNRLDVRIDIPGIGDLATHLILEGWAVYWSGFGKAPYPVWPREV